ncbi:dodecin [Indioceanicola profundi]|uniref:dodecin n=1 Tax=Indioceanicola profundi TaxID=2220096 RepID=UPI001CEC6AF8|nr:dodecin [Indioceanicola profundi]
MYMPLRDPAATADSELADEAGGCAYRTIEVVACSATGIEDAIGGAIERAGRALPHVEWFEVTDLRGTVVNGKVGRWQVGLRLGYRLDSADGSRNQASPNPVARA